MNLDRMPAAYKAATQGFTPGLALAEPHPVIVRRIVEQWGVSPSLARTVAILAGLGVGK
jgi:hypothetical protein